VLDMTRPVARTALVLCMLAVGASLPAFAAAPAPPGAGSEAVGIEPAMSADAQRLVDWIRRSGDHAGAPFVVIDKRDAHLWLFDADGSLRGHTAVLLGLARGDQSVPGIGERPMAQILAHERTTPAGRFVIEPGHNLAGEDVFWIDYDAAVSMHRVRATNPRERRLERLATPTPADNRISYGCVNVPVGFFDERLAPLLRRHGGVAYLLPETAPLSSLWRVDVSAPGRR
jgi:hypothetical protein